MKKARHGDEPRAALVTLGSLASTRKEPTDAAISASFSFFKCLRRRPSRRSHHRDIGGLSTGRMKLYPPDRFVLPSDRN